MPVDLRYVQNPFSFYRLTMPYLQADTYVAAVPAERCYPLKSFPFDYLVVTQTCVTNERKVTNPASISTKTHSSTNL